MSRSQERTESVAHYADEIGNLCFKLDISQELSEKHKNGIRILVCQLGSQVIDQNNILHDLINNARNVTSTEILKSFIKFPHTICFKVSNVTFQNSVCNFFLKSIKHAQSLLGVHFPLNAEHFTSTSICKVLHHTTKFKDSRTVTRKHSCPSIWEG